MQILDKIEISELPFTQSIIKDYFQQSDTILSLQSYPPSIEGIEEKINNQNPSINQEIRNDLVEVLTEQLLELGEQSYTKQALANINELKSNQCHTITTGQQLHPFLGPGYVIIKILECIELSKTLNSKGHYVKPVFWMASEDHDTDEISELPLFGESYTFSFPKNITTGKISCEMLFETIAQIEERLGDEAKGFSFFQLCKAAYYQNNTLSQATRAIIYSLFAKDEIIVIDADHPKLKKHFKAVFKEEIEQLTTTHIQEEVHKEFNQNNWHYQVMPRTNNLFEIDEHSQRHVCEDKSFKEEKNYSPNALLRPLFQETLLPNLVYVGGLAEVNYWLQLKSTFLHYNVNMPIIWPRNSFLYIGSKKLTKTIESTSLDKVLHYDAEEHIKQFMKENDFTPLAHHVEDIYQLIQNKSKRMNSQEWKDMSNSLHTFLKNLKSLERKDKKNAALSPQFTRVKDKMMKIRDMLFNPESLQERQNSVLELELNYRYISKLQTFVNQSQIAINAYYLLKD